MELYARQRVAEKHNLEYKFWIEQAPITKLINIKILINISSF